MHLQLRTRCLHPPSPPPHHASATAFRAHLLTHSASSKARILHLPTPHRLTATPQGGDCFFHALSWSLPYTPAPNTLRQALATHVKSEGSFYATALLARGFCQTAQQARAHVHGFCERVLAAGVRGHWLGAEWGELELLACVRAFGVGVELFTFDVDKQRVRLYFGVEGEKVVRLLFTGRADAGHFDALLPVARVRMGWTRRRGKAVV